MPRIPDAASTIVLWLFGFLYGLRHSLEPDHLAAVSTLVRSWTESRRALEIGFAWGLGHAAALAIAVFFAVEMPRLLGARDQDVLDLPAAVVMIAFGLWSLVELVRVPFSEHESRHSVESMPADRSTLGGFTIGMAHGLCGSGVVSVMIAAALPTLSAALAYVLFLGLGSVVGMAAMSTLLAVPFRASQGRPLLHLGITGLSGLASLAIGVDMALRVLAT